MEIISLTKNREKYERQIIALLQTTFECYSKLKEATSEAKRLLRKNRICLGLVEQDFLIGLVGGIPMYDGNVYELHPLIVHENYRRKGYGSKLLQALEAEVCARGGMTVYLGSDDEHNQTSLANVDIYDNLWERIKNIQNINNHPYTFYVKNGYQIVGVTPDANGYGKPDIWLAKRVGIKK